MKMYLSNVLIKELEHQVKMICEVLRVSRSRCYQLLHKSQSKRDHENKKLTDGKNQTNLSR
ncbi:hypothetical protein [Vulcanibacillus modesticaldus]|uniref:hypothetical protein n=1 Tax=Vulcanibacillus modesticaldus TaxID=337097 RepID=UPI00114C8F3E|nr:hypothetical protein [Vulcanibacillus modesticaldus]